MRKINFLAFVLLFLAIGTALAADKDTLVIRLAADAASLDPQDVNEIPSFNVWMNIFDTFLHRSPDLKVTPHLATSYRQIDSTTWELKLRRGVKFHNGEDFNAQSAKFSLERVMDPKTKLKQSYHQDYYERIEIMDDYTIRIIPRISGLIWTRSSVTFRP